MKESNPRVLRENFEELKTRLQGKIDVRELAENIDEEREIGNKVYRREI